MVMFGNDMAMNQTCYALVSKGDAPFFLFSQLHTTIDSLVQGGHGSVFNTVTTTTFAGSKVAIPPNGSVETFEHQVTPLFHRILSLSQEMKTLAALRDALLPRLLSGELRVPEAERAVGAAL